MMTDMPEELLHGCRMLWDRSNRGVRDQDRRLRGEVIAYPVSTAPTLTNVRHAIWLHGTGPYQFLASHPYGHPCWPRPFIPRNPSGAGTLRGIGGAFSLLLPPSFLPSSDFH